MMLKWLSALTQAAPLVEEAAELIAEPAAQTASSALTALPLFTKGLLVTLMGLLGVFLVLTLFFVTIKLMQKLSANAK